MGRLDGRVAVVTGGATGIGRAIARRFVEEGASVAIGQLGAEGSVPVDGARLEELDVRKEEAVEAFISGVIDRFGHLDIAVNNAALTGPPVLAPLLDHSSNLFRDILETNLLGSFFVTRAAAKAMVVGGAGGRIINVASIDSFVAEEFAAGYVSAKTGLLGLTRASAVELARHGIRVTAIAPGQIFTEAGVSANEMVGDEALPYRHYRESPLGAGGRPDDVAAVAAFLASEDAAWVNGAAIVVDGGFLAC